MSSEVERKTVCVTGGNGYVASLLVKMLLEKGYAVQTSVRDPSEILLPFFLVTCFSSVQF